MGKELSTRVAFRTSVTQRDYIKITELAGQEGQTIQDVVRRLLSFYLLLNTRKLSDAEIVETLREKKLCRSTRKYSY